MSFKEVRSLHKYLRAIGFSELSNRKELKEILNMIINSSDEKQYVSRKDDGIIVEYRKEFSPYLGIAVCGEFSEINEFDYEYYYPYFKGNSISSYEDITVERHAEKDSFAGICDDIKVGVSLIFYLQNRMDYMKEQMADQFPVNGTSVNLTALSCNGSIMLPLNKNEKQMQNVKKAATTRSQLIAAARQGDEEAIESLTLEDIDTYTTISRKILKEDVFTLVDTYFMPYGIECDQYSVLGEILNYEITKNKLTKEETYIITINCNDLNLDVCINKKDLIGEIKSKRRFKGIIWLQGHINFPK